MKDEKEQERASESEIGTVDPIEQERKINTTIYIDPPESYVYSNVAGITLSPWDIRINFADINLRKDQSDHFKATTGVILPPEHAASLVLLLMGQLVQYEKQFGPIREPRWKKFAEEAKTAVPKTKT